MKVIIAPDKFKGSLTSFEACAAIATGLQAADKNIETFQFPMADGGDGFAAVMKHYLGTATIECDMEDPLGRPIHASYELDGKNSAAIIELASASGLVLLKEEERSALRTSTFGSGRMIKHAVEKGVKTIILGLGGSATNDAGTGILSALGFLFTDKDGALIKACGEKLACIETIIPPPELPDVSFEIACDVQNVLYGPRGAAYVYAPQKGASPEEVSLLDAGLMRFAEVLARDYGKDIAGVPGTGAAGGIAAGLMGFFDVRLKRGITLVMDAAKIRDEIPAADLVITGEGKIDGQTEDGKVVSALAALASEKDVPVTAFCGVSEIDIAETRRLNLRSIQVITPAGMNRKEAMANARTLLAEKVTAYIKSLSR